jgi:predicted nucleic acid-binding protein
LLVIDDRHGRIVAGRRGLVLIGVVGVLLEAHAKGLVGEVRPLLDDLGRRAGFWLSDRVRREILKSAGEDVTSI